MEPVCRECGFGHLPKDAHDHTSPYWQRRFFDKHGRLPTFSDAIAHCPEDVKAINRNWYISLRRENGEEVPPDLLGQGPEPIITPVIYGG